MKALLFPRDTPAPLPCGYYKVVANGYLVLIEKMEQEELRLWQIALEALYRAEDQWENRK